MVRLVLIVALIWAASVVYRRLASAPPRPRRSAYGGKMVKCSECGVFLPRRDAVELGDGRMGCATHRRSGGD